MGHYKALSPVCVPDGALAGCRGNRQKTQRALWPGLKPCHKQESTRSVVSRWPYRDRNGKPIVRVGPLIRHHMVFRFLVASGFVYHLFSVVPVFNDYRPFSVGTVPLISWPRGASGHKVGYGWGRVRVRIRARALLPSLSLRSWLTD